MNTSSTVADRNVSEDPDLALRQRLEEQFTNRQSTELTQEEVDTVRMDTYQGFVNVMERKFNSSLEQPLTPEQIEGLADDLTLILKKVRDTIAIIPQKKDVITTHAQSIVRRMLIVIFSSGTNILKLDENQQQIYLNQAINNIDTTPQFAPLVDLAEQVYPGIRTSSDILYLKPKGSDETLTQLPRITIDPSNLELQTNISQIRDARQLVQNNIEAILRSPDQPDINRLFMLIDNDGAIRARIESTDPDSLEQYAEALMNEFLNKFVSVTIHPNDWVADGLTLTPDACLYMNLDLGNVREVTKTDGVLSLRSYDTIANLALTGNLAQQYNAPLKNGGSVEMRVLNA